MTRDKWPVQDADVEEVLQRLASAKPRTRREDLISRLVTLWGDYGKAAYYADRQLGWLADELAAPRGRHEEAA